MKSSTKEILNKISPTMCMAKWHRTNLRLDTGYSYSCHHCTQNKINIESVKENPSNLTNTPEVLAARQKMLNGERPEECNYCWTAEDNGMISDRLIKSNELLELVDVTEDVIVNPAGLEVSFDRTCNLKCAYCGPKFSTKWEEEIKRYGSYPTTTKRQDLNFDKILNREENPYIEAFWKWWPELKNDLKMIRITGGEPLLSKHTYRFLDMLIEDKAQIAVAVNSNLTVDLNPLLERLKRYNFNHFNLYVSLESNKEKGEYSRYGLDYDLFTNNVETYLSETKHNLHFMLTNNMLSITSYDEFIEYYVDLKKRYGKRIQLSSTQLRYPAYFDIRLIDEENKQRIRELTRNILKGSCLMPYEIAVINRTLDHMDIDIDNKEELRKDFVRFVMEADKRRDTDFLDTYPEYEEFVRTIYKSM